MEFAAEIALRTAAVYLFLLLGLRLLGRGEAAQLRTIDLVLLLVLANAVQNAMVGPDTSLGGGLVAAGTLLVVARLLHLVESRFPGLRRRIEGEPVLLARRGKLVARAVARAGLSAEDLAVAARRVGVPDLRHIELAILEADGEVSVIGRTAGPVRSRRATRTRAPRRARS